ncbi:hypothetical protein HMPREF9952_2334 [Haemophilus pittmaniae HK 85]|uniref:Uncharacterized protein n=1 Tax=Haemophilus pittmaniae HK 85 TaxID=1035188 RepID=F9Q6R9_9PAST|nr:hypothetical protein HMPREF9952_2334 [Haemophilus pittmaniae HK 85]
MLIRNNKKPHHFGGVLASQINYLIASFNALPETNAGTLDAAILISAPVCGLRPVRAARWFTLNVPKPINCTGSPFLRLAVIASKVASKAALACFYLILLHLQLHRLNLFCS